MLLLIPGLALIFVSVHLAVQFSAELDRKRNQYLARGLAAQFKEIMKRFPPPKNSLDFDAAIDTVLPHFIDMNPMMKIYLLGRQGTFAYP